MDKTIKQLRLFFRISNASFDVAYFFNMHLKNAAKKSEMKRLHKMALEEIEKKEPDLMKMYALLTQMIIVSEQPLPKTNID